METIRTMTAWVLFLIMAVIAAFFWQQSASRGRQNIALKSVINEMEGQVLAMAHDIDILRDQVTQAEEVIAMIHKPDAFDEETAGHSDGDILGGLNLSRVLDALLDPNQETSDTPSRLAGLVDMFSGPQGEELMKASVRMNLNMQFQDFFDMLAPDAVETVRAILDEYLVNVAKLSLDMFANTGDKAAQAAAESYRETMRDALRQAIGEEGLQLYEQYEEELPGKMLDTSLDMQLRLFAGRLSEETRDLVRCVIYEELYDLQTAPAAPVVNPETMGDLMITQREGYERALHRLAPLLQEDEYAIVEGFIQQQQQIYDLAETMMGPLVQ